MVEVAESLERGRGVAKDTGAAIDWYRRAVHAGVVLAPALLGETIFDADPVAGIVWLLLGFERAPDGGDEAPLFASSLSVYEPRLSDDAVRAAQVWADACREREAWPDEVPMSQRVAAPFRARPPPPPLPVRTPAPAVAEGQVLAAGPWRLVVPASATVEVLLSGLHVRARSTEAHTVHLVSATLSPGVDLESYVRRSIASSGALWRPRGPADRFLLRGVDTFSTTLDGHGPSAGQWAIKRFAAVDAAVAVLTLVGNSGGDERPALADALFDSLERVT